MSVIINLLFFSYSLIFKINNLKLYITFFLLLLKNFLCFFPIKNFKLYKNPKKYFKKWKIINMNHS